LKLQVEFARTTLLTTTAVDRFYEMKITFAPVAAKEGNWMRLASRLFSIIVLHIFAAMAKRSNFSTSCRTCLQLLLA